ncbi:MAG: 1-acyl-sn-glycerol-3-phosphate acyltransferase [Planctomycetota bacterium]
MRRLAWALLSTQYRRIEVTGADRVPATGAAVVVANHFNSLVDSLAVLYVCPREVSPLAKAPLFGNRLLRPFLLAAGAVPVHRSDESPEGGKGVRAHAAMLEACRARLAEGRALIIFPEGVSQPRPKLMPLRAGAAHVALSLGAPVWVVPLGLVYEPPERRRGTLLARFGEPFQVDGATAGPRRPASIALTRRIEEALRSLLAEAESHGDLDALRTIETAFAQERGGAGATLESRHEMLRRFAKGLADLRRLHPGVVEEIRAETDALRRELALAGIPLELVDEAYTPGKVALFLLRHALFLVLSAPLAVAAALLTLPVRWLGDVIFMRGGRATEDVWALHRMAGEAVVLLASSVLVAIALALWRPWAGLAGLLAVPLLFAFLLLWRDWRELVRMRVRAFLLLAGGAMRKDLLRRRRALYERVLEASKLL